MRRSLRRRPKPVAPAESPRWRWLFSVLALRPMKKLLQSEAAGRRQKRVRHGLCCQGMPFFHAGVPLPFLFTDRNIAGDNPFEQGAPRCYQFKIGNTVTAPKCVCKKNVTKLKIVPPEQVCNSLFSRIKNVQKKQHSHSERDFLFFFPCSSGCLPLHSPLFQVLLTELNREPCANQGRARRCNRGRIPQHVTVRQRMGRRGRRMNRESEDLPEKT